VASTDKPSGKSILAAASKAVPSEHPAAAAGTQLQRQDAIEVIEELEELLPGDEPVIERVRQVILASSYSGPMPPPALFKQYGEVVADAPERILRVFEADSKHVNKLQESALSAQIAENRRIHWMAFTLILCLFAISIYFANAKQEVLAGLVFTTGLAGAIVQLFQTRKSVKPHEPTEPGESAEEDDDEGQAKRPRKRRKR
jgi:uncharacterized membrane protein